MASAMPLREPNDGALALRNSKEIWSAIMAVAEAKKRMVRINGCVASAQAAKYADVDVIAAYPIRPYTATMMALAQMVANGELDAEYIVADSEHSQLSIAHGAASAGARVFTGSSGVGVQFAYELYSPISGSRMPVQMMIADRTLDPPGDFGSEHTDALSTRDMGWIMGWSCDAQEAFDNHLIAYRIGEDRRVLLPQMVCQDGFFVSHITGDVELPDAGQVREYLPPYKHPYPLDPRRPVSHGPQIMPEQGPPLQLERARAMEDSMAVIEQAHEEFGKIFGRHYDPWLEEYKTDDADVVFFLQGAHAVTARFAIQHMRERGIKVGMVRLRTIRPYPTERVREALSKFKVVGVIETNMALGSVSSGGALYAEAAAALYEADKRPLMMSFMAGMGGEAIVLKEFYWMTEKMIEAQKRGKIEKRTHWVGFEH
jgi:pyruvate ferredoxin oxidoreductase alpha subunit